VFVNESFSMIMARVNHCGLSGVQLHGQEPPELVTRLRNEGLIVIKALFVDGFPDLSTADRYNPTAYLVECSKGKLPGGNAMVWRWKDARAFGEHNPLIIAGGLSPENVTTAIADAKPGGVDVSSGIETSPGMKDLEKVAAFIRAVHQAPA
ncbi:MAG: phosphoribosylanthranilate isomerase, partial [Deltaproteobacteria bacterium]|nr:phosphoribosylanthranilate isomerase [Deltaproteobacteria bacterium]